MNLLIYAFSSLGCVTFLKLFQCPYIYIYLAHVSDIGYWAKHKIFCCTSTKKGRAANPDVFSFRCAHEYAPLGWSRGIWGDFFFSFSFPFLLFNALLLHVDVRVGPCSGFGTMSAVAPVAQWLFAFIRAQARNAASWSHKKSN